MRFLTQMMPLALSKLGLIQRVLEKANLDPGVAEAAHEVRQSRLAQGSAPLWMFHQDLKWRFIRGRHDLIVQLDFMEGNVENNKTFVEIATWDSVLSSRKSVFWGYNEGRSPFWTVRNDAEAQEGVSERRAIRRVEELVATFVELPEDAPAIESAQSVVT